LVVLGVPLTIDVDAFKTANGDLEASLRMICDAIHAPTVASRLRCGSRILPAVREAK